MISCLIIEDEKIAAERLSRMILSVDREILVTDVLQSVEQSVQYLKQHPVPELIFMDIQLADGLSFEIFEQIEVNAPVIFTTAYNEYAIKAFKVNSIDYLLKPIDLNELTFAIKKYKTQKSSIPINDQVLATLAKALALPYKSNFLIKVGEHLRSISTHDIQCFYSSDKSAFLLNAGGRIYPVNYSLDQMEGIIDPKLFFRISRKFIVSRSFISDIVQYSNSRLKVRLATHFEEDLIVSRERVQDFRCWLDQ